MADSEAPEILEALAAADRWIREGRPRRALEALAEVRPVAPEHPELSRLEAEARRAVEALDARARVRPLVDRARKLALQGNLEQALALAEEAVAAAPDDARALRLRDELAERSTHRRAPGPTPRPEPRPASVPAEPAVPPPPAPEPRRVDPEVLRARRVEALVADARRMLEAGRFQACLGLAAQLAKLAPDHPAARELQDQAEAQRRQSEARLSRIKTALAEGRQALAAGDGPLAADRFAAVLADDPGHAEARRGLAEARARVALQERIDALLDSARARFGRDDVEAADRDVQEALRLAPRDPEGLDLSDRIWLRGRELRARRAGAVPEPASRPGPPASEGAPAPTPETSTLRMEPPRGAAIPPSAATPASETTAPEATAPDAAGSGRRQPDAPREPTVAELADEAARLIREGRPDRALEILARLRQTQS